MKTAIISDIHGNDPALSAVLADAKACGVDRYLFAGDAIFDLPYANEVTERIRALPNAVSIRGNRECWLADMARQDPHGWIYEQLGAAHQTFEDMTPDNRAWLSSLPDEARIPLDGYGEIYTTHFINGLHGDHTTSPVYSSSYRIEMEKKPFTPDDYRRRMQAFVNMDPHRAAIIEKKASVVVFGHTHLQWHATVGGPEDILVINPGSCGEPLDYDTRAAYTILHSGPGGLSVEERRVPYDIESVIAYTRESRMYKRGEIWCELVFTALRSGGDCYSLFFAMAELVKQEMDGNGPPYDNAVWRETAARYFS